MAKFNRSNRINFGGINVRHRDHLIPTVVGSQQYEDFFMGQKDKIPYNVGYIPVGYEHRPDLISDLFYNTPSFWWLILQFNEVHNPFESLNVGDRVLIPKI